MSGIEQQSSSASKVSFVVFHTGVESLETYLPLMMVSREALAVTNPGARYVVLTDRETAPKLEKQFEVEVLAPSGEPLMRQYVMAQLAYEEQKANGLVVLAATDCVASRDLRDSLQHPMAITYRMRGKNLINNIAYIRDHEMATWFLKRALSKMLPRHYAFWGDQQSWEDALGPFSTWEQLTDQVDGLRVARPAGKEIHLYPCRTHNYFAKKSGAMSEIAKNAFLVHFKGARKNCMVESVRWFLLNKGSIPEWRLVKEQVKEKDVLPMQRLRTKK